MSKGATVGMPTLKDAKMKPRASVHWDGTDLKLSGDNPSLGDKVRLVVEGKISGFSMQDYGNNIELEAKSVKVEHLGSAEEGETMVELVKARGKEK
jgi:hypothetical protein